MYNKINITENYSSDKKLRNYYNDFISKVFPGISFKDWHKLGFWTKDYIPFSIIESGKIISNVSAALMTTIVNGEKHRAIQIGAVGTLPEYRKKGFSKYLTNYVLDKYKNSVDHFFLFANDSVLDFYPKFGFKYINENIWVLESHIPKSNYSARKLVLTNENDYNLLIDLIKNRKSITNIFGAANYGFITMWHVINQYSNNMLYLEDENIIFIISENNGTVNIIDVIFSNPFDFQSTLPKILQSDSVQSIIYSFPPDQLKYNFDVKKNKHSGLFTLGKIELSDTEVKFPETAHT